MAEAASVLKKANFETEIQRASASDFSRNELDSLAVEEPLEIRPEFSENGKFLHKAVSVTMRTPENDYELAAGFLFTEGILQSKNQIASIKYCGKFPDNQNTVRIDLQAVVKISRCAEFIARNYV